MYKIIVPVRPGENLILLQRKAIQRAIAFILFLFGSPLFLMGLLLLLGEDTMRAGGCVAAVGIFFVCGALLILSQRTYPEKFVFDNAAAMLIVHDKDGNVWNMPYAEIAGFLVSSFYESGREYFALVMEKRDGAVWTFDTFLKRENADRALSLMQKHVQLHPAAGVDVERLPESDIPSWLRVSDTNDISVVSWKQQYSSVTKIAGYGAIFSFGILLYFIAGIFRENLLGYVIALLFSGVLICYSVIYFFYSIRRVYVLEIGRGLVRYYTRGLFAKGLSFSLPIDRIDAVLYNFSIRRAESVIYFLSKEERARMLSIMRGNISNIIDDVLFMAKLPCIEAGGLSATEKLYLEAVIQKAMKGHGGKKNL